MLYKQTCPYTGLVNYYVSGERILPVGSIQRESGSLYVWRYHLADGVAGSAATRNAAEGALKQAVDRSAVDIGCGDEAARQACC